MSACEDFRLCSPLLGILHCGCTSMPSSLYVHSRALLRRPSHPSFPWHARCRHAPWARPRERMRQPGTEYGGERDQLEGYSRSTITAAAAAKAAGGGAAPAPEAFWWERSFAGGYLPALEQGNPQLASIMEQLGWAPAQLAAAAGTTYCSKAAPVPGFALLCKAMVALPRLGPVAAYTAWARAHNHVGGVFAALGFALGVWALVLVVRRAAQRAAGWAVSTKAGGKVKAD